MKTASILRISLGLAVVALFLVIKGPVAVAQNADSAEISSLLSDAQHHAVLLDDDASTLQSYTRSKLHWQSHAQQLEAMKTHVNNLGKISAQLSDLRSEGSPWQQQAIDHINPLLKEMADHLTATINHLNDHQSQIHMPAYQDYARGNYELASRISELINDYVNYDKARSQSMAFEQKLQMPVENEGN
jgi:phosphatidylserine/phosphatidylglycerophosphate/cardiolipin synthase-like enzyme